MHFTYYINFQLHAGFLLLFNKHIKNYSNINIYCSFRAKWQQSIYPPPPLSAHTFHDFMFNEYHKEEASPEGYNVNFMGIN